MMQRFEVMRRRKAGFSATVSERALNCGCRGGGDDGGGGCYEKTHSNVWVWVFDCVRLCVFVCVSLQTYTPFCKSLVCRLAWCTWAPAPSVPRARAALHPQVGVDGR